MCQDGRECAGMAGNVPEWPGMCQNDWRRPGTYGRKGFGISGWTTYWG
ncbi:hypothetical protein CBFG_02641 [Clostridiales bacterium 1_7_47FAA]|nr:hypothetical protein CBFG_02641 [Clostridiales bacterium 1_7_47FAA]